MGKFQAFVSILQKKPQVDEESSFLVELSLRSTRKDLSLSTWQNETFHQLVKERISFTILLLFSFHEKNVSFRLKSLKKIVVYSISSGIAMRFMLHGRFSSVILRRIVVVSLTYLHASYTQLPLWDNLPKNQPKIKADNYRLFWPEIIQILKIFLFTTEFYMLKGIHLYPLMHIYAS